MESAIARCKHGVFRYLPNERWCGRSLELYGEWSDAEVGLLERLVPKGGTMIELGSNLGAHTVPLAKHIGPEGRVLAFEPQGRIHQLLVQNLRANGVAFVEARREAVGAKRAMVRMPAMDYDAPDGNFCGMSLAAGEGTGEKVRVVTIDSLKLEWLDLIKADIEGMEAEALRGARDTIRRLRPILYVENDKIPKSAELIALIMELGYRLWWHTPPLYDPANFRNNGVNAWPGTVSVNMLCIPKETKASIAYLREVKDPGEAWEAATQPRRFERAAPAEGQERVAVLQSGAYGDALFCSSVCHGLKQQGCHVTVYTEGPGEEILRHDPNVDRLVVVDPLEKVLGDIVDWFKREKAGYARAITLDEGVAKNNIGWPSDIRFYWPDEVRRKIFGGNYLERLHDIAGLPHQFAQRFHQSAEEMHWAASMRSLCRHPVAVIAASGSTAPKFWPYLEQLADGLLERGWEVWILGDLKGQEFAHRTGLHVIGTQWAMRQACTWARQADLVVGQETGLLNAVAQEPMPKIVLLTHSTVENLTKHWTNTVALAGAVPCYPCHRIHFTVQHCPRDEKTGAAACQGAISPAHVLECVDMMVRRREAVAA